MTKSTGVGRGKGGGRPRKIRATPAEAKPLAVVKAAVISTAAQPEEAEKQVAKIVAAAASVASSGDKVATTAANLVHEAYATLADVMANCPLGAPRVAAAKAIIELARAAEAEAAKAKADADGVTGKKAAAQATAEAKVLGGGKFSAPAPPPGVMPGPDRFQ